MVELKLDVAESASFSDCFVSVRVGDTQKLSRLAGSRLYSFPQAGERRYGKIEVYRRIGSCGVDVDPLNEGIRQVQIGCGDAGTLKLGVEVNGGGKNGSEEKPAEQKEPAGEKSKSQSTKSKVAKEYLRKHSLELQLSEAMQAVLRAKPDDPVKFLAETLMKNVQGGGVALPTSPATKKETSPKPEAMPLVPEAAAASPKAAKVTEKKPSQTKPFLEYYRDNFQVCTPASLYSKFPGVKKTTSTPPAASPGLQTEKEAPPVAAPAPAATPAPVAAPAAVPPPLELPFRMMPSVGSWLAGKPKLVVGGQPAAPAPPPAAPAAAVEVQAEVKAAVVAPVAAPAAAPVVPPAAPTQWFLQPSIGTWHAKISKVQVSPAAATSSTGVSKEEKAAAPAAPVAAPAPAAAAAAPPAAAIAAADPVPLPPPNRETAKPLVVSAGVFGPNFNSLGLQPRMVFI